MEKDKIECQRYEVLEIKEHDRDEKLELKHLPRDMKYVYLGENETKPVIISSSLTSMKEETYWGFENS